MKMKKLLLGLLLCSCTLENDTAYNYPKAIVVGKDKEDGYSLLLRYRDPFTVRDTKYILKWISVPTSEYEKFNVNDTIPK